MLSSVSFTDLKNQREEYLKTSTAKQYKSALKQTRHHQLQYSLIQDKPKLMWELRNALPVFFWLISHINRNDGSSGPVWAELDKLYNAGYLVAVRHILYMAKEFDCNPSTISAAVSLLEDKGFIRVLRNYTWGTAKRGWKHSNLYLLGYKEDEGEMYFYHTACQEYAE